MSGYIYGVSTHLRVHSIGKNCAERLATEAQGRQVHLQDLEVVIEVVVVSSGEVCEDRNRKRKFFVRREKHLILHQDSRFNIKHGQAHHTLIVQFV